MAESQKTADEFLTTIRTSLKVEDESELVWFAPGQLLVIGMPKRHAAFANALAALEDGKTRPEGALGVLSDVTRKRFAARKERIAKAAAAGLKLDVALAHDHFSWQLLSAAVGGELNLESLTELQIAWKSPHTAELLNGPAKSLLLRSLWTVCDASRVLPNEQELAALAASARTQCQSAAADAITALEKDRKDTGAIVSVLFAALANSDDAAYRAKATPLLTAPTEDDAASTDMRILGRLLVGKALVADQDALAEMLKKAPTSSEHVALLALACRRVGPEHWELFRAASRDLLGNQPLPGEVVVLVNQLAQFQIKGQRAE
jgi:hypothetical protein